MNENKSNNKTTGQPDNLDITPEAVHPTKTTKWLNRVVIAAMIVIAIGLGIMLKWSLQDENVLVVKNSPFPVRTIREHPTDNGVIIMSADYCKNIDTEGRLRMSFVSQTREVFLPLAPERGPVGCNKVEVPVIIPKDLIPDTYKVKFHVTYDVNPLKKNVVVDFESRQFTVYPTDVDNQ